MASEDRACKTCGQRAYFDLAPSPDGGTMRHHYNYCASHLVQCTSTQTGYLTRGNAPYGLKWWSGMEPFGKIVLRCRHPDGIDHAGDCFILMPKEAGEDAGKVLIIEKPRGAVSVRSA